MKLDKKPDGPPKSSLVIAVISDVHAYHDKEPDKAPSHCSVAETDPTKNALVGLRSFIQREQLASDLLFCPGDLGDKAQPIATQHVWKELNDVKAILGAKELIPTTGNHDVDSRHEHNAFDAKGMLQALVPRYPFADERLTDQYWSRHFVIIDGDCFRLLVLNSSAFHGEGRFDQTRRYEFEQGRVSDYTLTLIRNELDKSPTRPINILLCHHHPHPHSELRLGADDLMIGGGALLEILGSGKYGSWLVIHGHKHHPKLEYASGGATSPVVFAAGSLSAVLYRELQTVSRNQFYLIEFPYSLYGTLGFVGRFRSWDWSNGHGWIVAPNGSKLPGNGGFGWRGNIDTLAAEIKRGLKKGSLRWADIVKKVPYLDYVLPQDLNQLVHRLRADSALVVEPDDSVPPTLIGRAK